MNHPTQSIPAATWQQQLSLPAGVFLNHLAEPLHQELANAGDFSALDEWLPMQQVLLCLDYVHSQVAQGGFIQLFQNGYAPLLAMLAERLNQLGFSEASAPLDQALQVFVLNHAALSAETTTEEFAKLYDEFREFEPLEAAWNEAFGPLQQQLRDAIVADPAVVGIAVVSPGPQ